MVPDPANFLRIDGEGGVPDDLPGRAPSATRFTLSGRSRCFRPPSRHGHRFRGTLDSRGFRRRHFCCARCRLCWHRRLVPHTPAGRTHTTKGTGRARYRGRPGRWRGAQRPLPRRHHIHLGGRQASELDIPTANPVEVLLQVIRHCRLIRRTRTGGNGHKGKRADRKSQEISHDENTPSIQESCRLTVTSEHYCKILPLFAIDSMVRRLATDVFTSSTMSRSGSA